jgi:hypothetical protein
MNTDHLITVNSFHYDDSSMRILAESFPQLNWNYEYDPYDRWKSMDNYIGTDKNGKKIFRVWYAKQYKLWSFETINTNPSYRPWRDNFSDVRSHSHHTGHGSTPKEAYEDLNTQIGRMNDILYKDKTDLDVPCVLAVISILFPLISSLVSSF